VKFKVTYGLFYSDCTQHSFTVKAIKIFLKSSVKISKSYSQQTATFSWCTSTSWSQWRRGFVSD